MIVPAGTACRVTDRVDCFSFGVLLWEIVTGEWPVRGSLRMPLVPQVRLPGFEGFRNRVSTALGQQVWSSEPQGLAERDLSS